jgi:hypothetical protein
MPIYGYIIKISNIYKMTYSSRVILNEAIEAQIWNTLARPSFRRTPAQEVTTLLVQDI